MHVGLGHPGAGADVLVQDPGGLFRVVEDVDPAQWPLYSTGVTATTGVCLGLERRTRLLLTSFIERGVEMRILTCTVDHFRGFDHIEVVPRGHVLLVGEPRSGRTDLLAALGKVLETDIGRLDELDFHRGDTAHDVSIEITLGDLDHEIRQRFLDQLEFWDPDVGSLLVGVADPAALGAQAVPVVRLGYRGRWDPDEERADQTIYWAKTSDPSTDALRRVSRSDRSALPYVRLTTGRPLSLAARGALRASLDSTDADAVGDALREISHGIEQLSTKLSRAAPVITALDGIIEPLRAYLGVDYPVDELVLFLPEGGSLSALMRALAPALDLHDGAGHLPLARHGSTTLAQVASAEAIITSARSGAVILVDDFGDTLDAASAQRLATLLRRGHGQVWLSTRRPETARAFEADELVRLTRGTAGGGSSRLVHYGRVPTTRAERVAARELHRQILPAMTAKALLVVEGPHDVASYGSLSERREADQGVLPPEAYGIGIIDAGSTDGGIDKVARVADLARRLGFRVVVLIDYDNDDALAASRLAAAQAAADAVVRFPKGVAIELAILDGLSDSEIIDALRHLNAAYMLPLPAGWQSLTGAALKTAAREALKSNNGLHAHFIGALPTTLPALASAALDAAVEAARAIRVDALIQL
jgi:putative ATP-dependent endonuclease of OLD family